MEGNSIVDDLTNLKTVCPPPPRLGEELNQETQSRKIEDLARD